MQGRNPKFRSARMPFIIHSFLGLKLTMVLTLVLLSGTLAVISHEIDWLTYPQMRVSSASEHVSPGTLYDTVQKAYPDHGIDVLQPGILSNHVAAFAKLTAPNGARHTIWINQFTGAIQGETPEMTLGAFLAQLHRTLFLPGIGRSILNIFGPIILISLITGLITYKRFWRGFFKLPRGRDLRTFLGDIHRLLAVWSLWFALIIGITGTWWFYEDPVSKFTGAPALYEKSPQPAELGESDFSRMGPYVPIARPLDDLLNITSMAYPRLVPIRIVFPRNALEPLKILGTRGEILIKQYGNLIQLNPYTGQILAARMGEEISTMQRIHQAMDPLHYGTWAQAGLSDLIVKFIWFVFGLILTTLTATGLIIFLKRSRKAAGQIAVDMDLRAKTARQFNILQSAMNPLGSSKYINISLLALIALGTILALVAYNWNRSEPTQYRYKELRIGPWSAEISAVGRSRHRMQDLHAGQKVKLIVRWCLGDFADVKQAFLRIGNAPRQNRYIRLAETNGKYARVRLVVPPNTDEYSRIWLTVESWQGKIYKNSWPLHPKAQIMSRNAATC